MVPGGERGVINIITKQSRKPSVEVNTEISRRDASSATDITSMYWLVADNKESGTGRSVPVFAEI